jgi:hypothetical protein
VAFGHGGVGDLVHLGQGRGRLEGDERPIEVEVVVVVDGALEKLLDLLQRFGRFLGADPGREEEEAQAQRQRTNRLQRSPTPR